MQEEGGGGQGIGEGMQEEGGKGI
jgi:hypothetical protein